MAFHIKLAATLKAKANPKAASDQLMLAAILRFQLLSAARLAGFRYL
jgi:hypothetical protein